MLVHQSYAQKFNRAAIQRKTKFCRFFLTEEGCKNGVSCAFVHNTEEFYSSPLTKNIAGNFSFSDDSTSVCSEETSLASVWSAETASQLETLPQPLRQCWADLRDEEDGNWQSMWAPGPQPEMAEPTKPGTISGGHSAAMTKAAVKAERREAAAAAAKAKREALTGAVLEGLLRQAQGPYVYQD